LAEAEWKPSPALLGEQVDAEVDAERPRNTGEAQVAEGEQPIVVQARAIREPEVIEVAATLVADAVAQRWGILAAVPGDALDQGSGEPRAEVGPEADEAAPVIAALAAEVRADRQRLDEYRVFVLAAVGLREGGWRNRRQHPQRRGGDGAGPHRPPCEYPLPATPSKPMARLYSESIRMSGVPATGKGDRR
jgi:hypothetical protein